VSEEADERIGRKDGERKKRRWNGGHSQLAGQFKPNAKLCGELGYHQALRLARSNVPRRIAILTPWYQLTDESCLTPGLISSGSHYRPDVFSITSSIGDLDSKPPLLDEFVLLTALILHSYECRNLSGTSIPVCLCGLPLSGLRTLRRLAGILFVINFLGRQNMTGLGPLAEVII